MATPDHYSTLGLHRRCTASEIRDAYRRMTRLFHPDLNPGSAEAEERILQINLAHEILGDVDRRKAYDEELGARGARTGSARGVRRPGAGKPLMQDVSLGIEELIRGAVRDVVVNDPGNPDGMETYRLEVPPETAPGSRFRIPRTGSASGGVVVLKITVHPGFRFKAKGSDLRCELRIRPEHAARGGIEWVAGPDGTRHRVVIPKGVARGEIIPIPGAGLPRSRGGRGNLLVRISYRVDVRIVRPTRGD